MPANYMGGFKHKADLNEDLPWRFTDKQQQFLTTKNMAVAPHTLLTQANLASWDLFFFLRMKLQLQ
jgi:hypothetical protein